MQSRSVSGFRIILPALVALIANPFELIQTIEAREAKASIGSNANSAGAEAKKNEMEKILQLINSGKLPAPKPLGPNVVLLSQATEIAMDSAIKHYQSIFGSGGWDDIPAGPSLKNGNRNDRVLALRNRLQITGDLLVNGVSTRLYDAQLEKAVMRFQTRHGLPPTAIADSRTVTALNVPVSVRLKQLQLNQDRLHGLIAQSKKARKIVVNIPAFELQAIGADSEIKIRTRVVVGKSGTPTPDLVANVRALNFYPYWHVPVSVVKADLMPKLLKDTSFLKKERIHVYKNWKEVKPESISWGSVRLERYVFRQDPGPKNALGVLRFDMPNRHAVYMHDTPKKVNFRFSVRASSAGCVRVANAPALARWIFDTRPDYLKNTSDEILNAGVHKTIRMSQKIPVFFIYLTAWPGGDGTAQFREDIYNRDNLGFHTADYGTAGQPDKRAGRNEGVAGASG